MQQILQEIADGLQKAVFSKPGDKQNIYKKVVVSRKKEGYQAEKFTETQAFHQNADELGLPALLCELATDYLQINAWTDSTEYNVLVSKKGKITCKKKQAACQKVQTAHNKQKNYIIQEGTAVPPLFDMGIFTKEDKVVQSMYDKFRQINRFVELIDDAVKDRTEPLNIIDFGCGKSYLTFVLYYYFTEIRKLPVQIIGLDLKKAVIEKCNLAAQKYGYQNLHFELGDINGYKTDKKIDMVITLHACDTATDYALYNAVSWNADMIFSVPCCQHELNEQMQSSELSILTRYGIIQERTAALMTDAIRGNLLQAQGYKTQILEFIDMAHTPKNLLIRAIKRPIPQKDKQNALDEATRLMQAFSLSPTLYNLLYKNA